MCLGEDERFSRKIIVSLYSLSVSYCRCFEALKKAKPEAIVGEAPCTRRVESY